MVKYPEDYNPILEYYERIKSGDEVVSRKIARVYRKLAEDLNGSVGADGTVYHYSHSRANHILEFAENYCRHSKGKLGGQLVVLELWEKAMLAAMFGFIDDEGRRRYREIILRRMESRLSVPLSGCICRWAMGNPVRKCMRLLRKRIRRKLYGARLSAW